MSSDSRNENELLTIHFVTLCICILLNWNLGFRYAFELECSHFSNHQSPYKAKKLVGVASFIY